MFHFQLKGKEAIEETQSDESSDEIKSNEEEIESPGNRRKDKRHVGPHDNGGLQRTISTGMKILTLIFQTDFLFI